ncbi:hypothetical protein M758_12G192400 [Ceratodon purpureus]|uniref:Potassium channel domain-containing protein n=1 Tax=Ceratodon purpureus TaxID=3225 RepID=A0A8T0GET4_CERPU|nr:hypothetical protein KC19_12G189000 [Ceratodon purpureus]KAG0599995.1 hypothetical protein M758_12G192400 [Ceratodon purpureus]
MVLLLFFLFSRLCRVRSAPPLETINASSPQQSRIKHLNRAARGLPPPPPSPFQEEGEGMSTIFKAIIALLIYLLVGLLSFFMLEIELEGTATSATVDALYFAIVTMTTVGYGDLVPKTVGAKLFTCAFVFTGFGLVGVLLSGAANYLVEKQEKLLVQKIYLKYMRKEHKKELVVDDDEVVAAHWKMLVAGVAVVAHFVAGMFALMWWEGMSFIDGFYLVCVTVTTLGYGDRSFRTQAGRIFAIFWILSSTLCVAQFFLYLAESRTEERQHEIACWALHRPTTPSDLEAADMDGDGVVSAAEFVIFKLKEVGKIAEEDVQDILKEFAALDYDESGTLNVSDIHISTLVKET